MFFFNFFGFLNFFKGRLGLFSFYDSVTYETFRKYTILPATESSPSPRKSIIMMYKLKDAMLNIIFKICAKLSSKFKLPETPCNPYKFVFVYKNYVFFSKRGDFKKSFETLNNFWGSDYNLLVFSFFYSFLYYRFRAVQRLSCKAGCLTDFIFQETFLHIFRKLPYAKIDFSKFYVNKPLYNLKNFNILQTNCIYNVNNSTNSNIKNNPSRYINIFLKYGFTKKYFYNSSIILFLKNFKLNSFFYKNVFNLKKNWTLIFSNTFLYKYINLNHLKSYTIYFLRKNRFFNKGRYSRNRQNYRTGVYWCLYVNIVAVIAIYYFFFRFSFNFGYFWWLFGVGINCFFFAKFVKYKLYFVNNFVNNFINLFNFYSTIINLLKLSFLPNFFKNFIRPLRKLNSIFKNSYLKFYFLNLQFYTNKFLY